MYIFVYAATGWQSGKRVKNAFTLRDVLSAKKVDDDMDTKKKETGAKASAETQYAYHWNYQTYHNDPFLDQKFHGVKVRRWMRVLFWFGIAVLLALIIGYIVVGIRLLGVQKKLDETQKALSTLQSDLTLYEHQQRSSEPLKEYVSSLSDAVLKVSGTVDGEVSGVGFLLSNGYILSDITATASEYPYVEDATGTRVACHVLFTDLDTHLSVLYPQENVSGKSLSITQDVPNAGEPGFLIGYLSLEDTKIAAEQCSVVSGNTGGQLVVSSTKESLFVPLTVLCDQNGTVLGAYTSLGKMFSLDGLQEKIDSTQQKLFESESAFGTYFLMNFDSDTTYESVSYEEAELYHVPQGLRFTSVVDESMADYVGIQVNDILCKINDTPVHTAEELEAALDSLPTPYFTATIYRNGKEYFIQLRDH